MSRKKILAYWYAGAAIATAIVVGVAALLLTILVTARSIRANALRLLAIADDIVANTKPIWKLADTNTVSAHLLEETRAVAQHASEAADLLEAQKPQAQ